MTQHNAAGPIYKRVLFKVSGEALMAESGFGIDPNVTARIARDIKRAVDLGVVVGVVIGGGNIFRGVSLAAKGADRVMAGSDWPVCLLAASYGEVVDANRALVAGLSDDERAAVLGGTAAHVYGLSARAPGRAS